MKQRKNMPVDHSDVLLGMGPIVTNLLVVDDDAIQRRVIAKIGQQAGHNVLMAATLDEAEAILRGEPIDCVTLDLGLGARNGVDLLKIIGQMGRSIMALIISGSADHVLEATRIFAERSGMELYGVFAKPLDFAALRQSLVLARQAIWIDRQGEKIAS